MTPWAESRVMHRTKGMTASASFESSIWCFDHVAIAAVFFRFLRQPNKPSAPRPDANRGRAAGAGGSVCVKKTPELEVNVTPASKVRVISGSKRLPSRPITPKRAAKSGSGSKGVWAKAIAQRRDEAWHSQGTCNACLQECGLKRLTHRATLLNPFTNVKWRASFVGANEEVRAMSRKSTIGEDWLDFIAGRQQGSIAVFLALIETHPDPQAMLSFLERAEQAALANVDPTPLSDRYIEGMRDMIDRARKHLQLRLKHI
jgi:hypothetical protein